MNGGRLAIGGGRMVLHGIGFPAILPGRLTGDIGRKQRTSIEDVERDKRAQLTLARIQAPECRRLETGKGACQKYDDCVS